MRFTFTGEETEVEKGFQLILGFFEITPQPFTCTVVHLLLPSQNTRLGNYSRIDVDLACVFGGWEV